MIEIGYVALGIGLGADAEQPQTAQRASRPRAMRGAAGVGARYSEEFRQQAVSTARASDKSVATVAGELQISSTTLRR